MQTLANYWLAWLVVAVGCWAYVIANQVRRVKGMMKSASDFNVEGSFKSFGQGIGKMIFVGFFGSISSILFIIAVLYNIFHE